MPKMKTHSGAKKRFSVTRTGKVQARAAAKRHRLTSKSKRMKHDGRSTLIMPEMNAKVILDNFLPYQQKLRRNNRQRLRKAKQLKEKQATKKEVA
jgi:large subunit ribosomal protein L35